DDGYLYALNGEDGTLVWSYKTNALMIFSSPALGDIDGDDKLEVVIGIDLPIELEDDNLYALNAEDGTLLWSRKTNDTFSSSIFFSSPALGDIDSDGKLEVIVGVSSSWDRHIYAFNGEDGTLLWSRITGDGVDSSPALGDIDGDGKLEVVVGCMDNHVYALNGEDGTLLWRKQAGREIRSSPALGDIDGDGKLEVVIGSRDNNLYALNGEDGTRLWLYKTEDYIDSSPALGDIDNDGKLEVIVGNWDGYLYALNAEDGTLLWSYKANSIIFSSPALGDIDGDSKLEVVVGCDDGYLYTLNGEDGTLLYLYDAGAEYPIPGVLSSPALGDIDRDGKLEVVVGSEDDNVYAFNFPSAGIHVYWQGLGRTSNFTRAANTIYVDPDNDTLSSEFEKLLGTDPLVFDNDTDGDGMVDAWEIRYGLNTTDPLDCNVDSDDDGLSNLREFTLALDPTDDDCDNDDLSDGEEIDFFDSNPLLNDSDGDGLTDYQEVHTYGSNPLLTDTDGDGLTDYQEVHTYGTDPTKSDTDGDGYLDKDEIIAGTDPTNFFSSPLISFYLLPCLLIFSMFIGTFLWFLRRRRYRHYKNKP
ncbi:MAG: FG-GAP-like repeat-containing protein, partial [Candidatus Heimdallarchaeaceae archaeon]